MQLPCKASMLSCLAATRPARHAPLQGLAPPSKVMLTKHLHPGTFAGTRQTLCQHDAPKPTMAAPTMQPKPIHGNRNSGPEGRTHETTPN